MGKEFQKPWTDVGAMAVRKHGVAHCMLYSELGSQWIADHGGPWHRWRLYPKHHQFMHVVEDQIPQSGNPKDNWCYADESAIGEGVKVAESCHANTIHRTVMKKHRL